MQDVTDSVMIALLPMTADWCHIELPHLTLVYAGEKSSFNTRPTAFNELVKDAASIAMLARPITLEVLSKERFGDEDIVDVFKLRPSSELMAMRNTVEAWNASEFPFTPHVTIGPTGTLVEMPPKLIAFDRVMVTWGDEGITFWLKR